jgi:thiol-disulfide isomerase/thioredoxin
MHFRKLLILTILVSPAWAGVVEDVRGALAQHSFTAADLYLKSYVAKNGVTAEYVEAYSWMARSALSNGDYGQANDYAKQTKALALEQLKQRPLDSEPHLPIGLGAAIEVQSQVLAARGQRDQAVAVLQTALRTYGNTSIRARLQKNLNLLSFEGRPAPALRSEQFLGSKPPVLAQLKGSPVLLFFWAHWCGDCKAEAPIITQLRSEFAPSRFSRRRQIRAPEYASESTGAIHALHLLADVRFQIVEGMEVRGFGRGRSHLFGQPRLQFVFAHFQQAAVGVVDDDEFLRVEQVMGDDQRAQGVVGGDAAGVADHVRVAGMQAQAVLEQDAGIHAGEDGHVALGRTCQISQVKLRAKVFVGF